MRVGVRVFCLVRSHLNLPIIEFAFPKPDDAIRDYLTGENMTEKEYGRFFHAVFKTIWTDHLSTHGTREGIYKRILDEVNGTVCTMKYTVRQAQFLSEPARCGGVYNL